MNNFEKGVNSVGQLLPPPHQYPSTSHDSAWKGVADSFRQTGESLNNAIKEFSDTQRKNEQKA